VNLAINERRATSSGGCGNPSQRSFSGSGGEWKECIKLLARELRFAFVFDEYEEAVHLYRDVFGLEVAMELDRQGGRGVILRVPAATLELFDVRHGDLIDDIEVGRRLDTRVRIAVRVDDLENAARSVGETGAEPMAPAVETPWGDRNQRFRARDGLQLTLFQSP
jgi:catechol 2,3-dioxygenase-like lactoylglutathione lyase family enzyme